MAAFRYNKFSSLPNCALFNCCLISIQRSWVGASKKQRDDLLVFIRHLAEDDKEGVMAGKVDIAI